MWAGIKWTVVKLKTYTMNPKAVSEDRGMANQLVKAIKLIKNSTWSKREKGNLAKSGKNRKPIAEWQTYA
jgi:hypothetical protein